MDVVSLALKIDSANDVQAVTAGHALGMRRVDLSPSHWTEIIPAGGSEDIVIRAGSGSFLTSLVQANSVGAIKVVSPPSPISGDGWTKREVAAGIGVFARATDGAAIALLAPATRG